MALLAEYAVTPDVFDVGSYPGEEVCRLHLQTLKEVLLREAIVRDLHDGAWSALFGGVARTWHPSVHHLVKELLKKGRLVRHAKQLAVAPSTDREWCNEAIASHSHTPLGSIIATKAVTAHFASAKVVSDIEAPRTSGWWNSRTPTVRPHRTLSDYQDALSLVARHARSIMYIDPYIDPDLRHYQDFATLLTWMGKYAPSRPVEIHRTASRGSGETKTVRRDEIEASFREKLSDKVRSVGMNVEVFLWDDFHDRFLISDLLGVHMSNGFDTTSKANAVTTWSRLGSPAKDEVQREFDPSSGRHKLLARFKIQ